MKEFIFIDKVPVEAYDVTTISVKAENLEAAKNKLIDYYNSGNTPNEYDETNDVSIIDIDIYHGYREPSCTCNEDGSELKYGEFLIK